MGRGTARLRSKASRMTTATRYTSRRDFAAANEKLPCNAPDCDQRRGGSSKFCYTHRSRVQEHGHPEARAIKATEWATERDEVATFVQRHADAPQIVAAGQWVADVFYMTNPETPGERVREKLRRFAVDPLDVLRTGAGLWTFATRFPRTLPDDARLTVALGLAVCRLLPPEAMRTYPLDAERYRRRHAPIGPVARREVGATLRDGLAPLFANIARAINDEAERERRTFANIRIPFHQQEQHE